MFSFLRNLFGCRHEWSKWSEPYQAKRHVDGWFSQTDYYMYTVWCQSRKCEKCNETQVRQM